MRTPLNVLSALSSTTRVASELNSRPAILTCPTPSSSKPWQSSGESSQLKRRNHMKKWLKRPKWFMKLLWRLTFLLRLPLLLKERVRLLKPPSLLRMKTRLNVHWPLSLTFRLTADLLSSKIIPTCQILNLLKLSQKPGVTSVKMKSRSIMLKLRHKKWNTRAS